jgi:hypothetical protein
MFIKHSLLAILASAALVTAKEAPSEVLVTEIPFDRASAELRSDGKAHLRDILSAAKSKGEVTEVKVISWADAAYPTPNKEQLDKNARKLADDRNQEVTGYLVDNTVGLNIKDYNMAERPNAMEDLLKTSDVRVKKALEKSGSLAKVSRSLVVVILK